MIDDVRLPEKWSQGSSGGPAFLTDIVQTVDGAEDREERWADPLATYDIAHNVKSPTDISALRAFHRARRGAARGFLLKDWIEYTSKADGVSTPTTLDQPLGTGDGSTTVFPIVKRYTDSAATYDWPVLYPVTGTVVAAKDGVTTTAFTVQRGAGTITFTSAPANGVVLTCGYQFDVPVRFAEDHLAVTWDTINSRSAGSVPLQEVRG